MTMHVLTWVTVSAVTALVCASGSNQPVYHHRHLYQEYWPRPLSIRLADKDFSDEREVGCLQCISSSTAKTKTGQRLNKRGRSRGRKGKNETCAGDEQCASGYHCVRKQCRHDAEGWSDAYNEMLEPRLPPLPTPHELDKRPDPEIQYTNSYEEPLLQAFVTPSRLNDDYYQ